MRGFGTSSRFKKGDLVCAKSSASNSAILAIIQSKSIDETNEVDGNFLEIANGEMLIVLYVENGNRFLDRNNQESQWIQCCYKQKIVTVQEIYLNLMQTNQER